MKPLVVTLQPDQLDWVKKSAKDQKLGVSEFVRAAINYLRDAGDPKEITSKLAKSRLEAEIEAATKKMEQFAKAKEKLEHELAKIEA